MNACRILVEKPKEKIPTGRTRWKWEANTTTDLRFIGWDYIGWIHLAEDRDQWMVL